MVLFLLRVWPAFIPIILYLVWHAYRKRKAIKAGDPKPALLSGPWQLTLLAALLLYGASLFYLALSAPKSGAVSYQPKQFKDGKLIREELR